MRPEIFDQVALLHKPALGRAPPTLDAAMTQPSLQTAQFCESIESRSMDMQLADLALKGYGHDPLTYSLLRFDLLSPWLRDNHRGDAIRFGR